MSTPQHKFLVAPLALALALALTLALTLILTLTLASLNKNIYACIVYDMTTLPQTP